MMLHLLMNLAPVLGGYDPADYYFVGALIALSCAIFSAANNIVIALVSLQQKHMIIITVFRYWCLDSKRNAFHSFHFSLEMVYQHQFNYYGWEF